MPIGFKWLIDTISKNDALMKRVAQDIANQVSRCMFYFFIVQIQDKQQYKLQLQLMENE